MRSLLLLAAVAVLSACASRPPDAGFVATPQGATVEPQRPATAPLADPPVAATAAIQEAPPPTASVVHGSLAHGASSPEARGPSLPTPPEEPGASRTAFEGCLLAANEADAARFPAPPATRTGGIPPVKVTLVQGGALVEHALTHACCLKAKVETHLAGRTAIVSEVLSGNPCRCRCGSTLRTAIALPSGTWTLVVDLEEGGVKKRVFQQEVRLQ